MKIKTKKLHKNAVLPFRATDGDAGADLTAVRMTLDKSNVIYDTGISVEIPKGCFGLLTNRSSIYKYDLQINTGIIDSGYRGELKVIFKRNGTKIYDLGDKIAQLIILPYELANFVESNELSESERGIGGFGHTGK